MYLFILTHQKGLRGGISYIAKRYAKANNKYMKNHDPRKPWLKNADNFEAKSISEKGPVGYILKVDLEYPEELHLLHNDYPLAPEKRAIPYDMQSDYCEKSADEYGIKVGDVEKLIPNLGKKN